MEKVQLDLPLLLPDIPDEKDQCVERLIQTLKLQRGIDEVHLQDGSPPQLCLHYQPQLITLDQVRFLALRSGAQLTDRYVHAVWNLRGIRHTRHARAIEEALQDLEGVLEANASASGLIRLEWDTTKITQEGIRSLLKHLRLGFQEETSSWEDDPIKTLDEKYLETDQKQSRTEFLGENTELYFAIGSGLCWLAGLIISSFTESSSVLSRIFFGFSLLWGGYFTVLQAVSSLRKGRFEIDFLMFVAALGAIFLGRWGEAALLLFLFSLGHALEHFAMNRARKSISALSDLAPEIALVKEDGKTVEKRVEALNLGDIVVVKSNSQIPADGVVVTGRSAVDQSAITGESVPVDKTPLEMVELFPDLEQVAAVHKVYAGTVNGSGVLEVKVLKKAKDSTLSRLVELVKEAETQKSPTQHLTDKFEKYYVPGVLIFVCLLMFLFLFIEEPFRDSFYRAMAVLIAASPCALAISTPSAVLAGVARAAKEGVLIKGGRPLEDLGELTVVAFDKTGTLTQGKPVLTDAVPYGQTSKEELLSAAIAVESLSDHPLATAIVDGGKKMLSDREILPAEDVEALTAKGVSAVWKNEKTYIGNRRLMQEVTGAGIPVEILQTMSSFEEGGHTAMMVYHHDRYLGVIAVMDVARPEAGSTIAELRSLGIDQMVMLTGDHQKVADAVAKSIGLGHPYGNLLPEDKVSLVKQLTEKKGKVAMVGDGVNDAPAMARSTVSIAMGAAGSDVALETADIALMADRLDNLPFAIGLSRAARKIIKQNLWISLGMVALLVPLTLFGAASIGWAVVAHEGSTVIVVLNALRLLTYRSKQLRYTGLSGMASG